jgi:mannose-1-phosphate guanylyltransferase
MIAVIMAGGKGTRFWPRSVEAKPKQFLTLTSAETMIQLTYRRFVRFLPKSAVYVITTRPYVAMLKEQLPELSEEQLILEPDQRDTGPCTALAALAFMRKGIDDVLVFAPSDQYIEDTDRFREALEQAEGTAAQGNRLVTLGIVPTRPETGYGYLRALPAEAGSPVLRVASFIEKPDRAKAEKLLREPLIYWNSGIFVWKPSTIEHYMQLHQPKLWSRLAEGLDRLEHVYPSLPKLSVDYAVAEKADSIYMVPADFRWDDVGLWTSLERIREPDAHGNIVNGDVTSVRTRDSIIHTEGRRAMVIGASDMIIVSTEHGLLVCHKSEEQHIKRVLSEWQPTKGGIEPV